VPAIANSSRDTVAASYYGVDLSETHWHQLGVHPQSHG